MLVCERCLKRLHRICNTLECMFYGKTLNRVDFILNELSADTNQMDRRTGGHGEHGGEDEKVFS